MAKAVLMPKAGITVESCLIGRWQKKKGDQVREGDILFEYETDKTSFECESTASGTLLEIFFEEGDEVACLTPVCAVGEPGEDVSALRPSGQSAPAKESEAPAAKAPQPAVPEPAGTESTAAAGISPRARKLAEKAGADPAGAVPSGPNGRVIERDIRKLLSEGPQEAPGKQAPPEQAEAPEFTDSVFNGIRRTISRNMKASLAGSAQLTHQFSFDAGAILEFRKQCKAAGGETAGITVGDMVLYAVAKTLLSCPDLNACMLSDTEIRHYHHVNLSVAVDTPRGLVVPVIRHADELSLPELSAEVKRLAEAARNGSLSPDQSAGGSVTVSNLGAFGVEAFTPVLNPPQTGIIGVCTIVERPRRGAYGNLELYPAMTLSLTYDHRAIDGAPASRYMQQLCRTLENFPALLV